MADRVLIVSSFFSTHKGGLEIIAGEIAKRLGAYKRVSWAATDTTESESLKDGYVTPIPLKGWNGLEDKTGLPWPVLMPAAISKLYRAIKEHDVVFIHDCIYMATILSTLFARWHGKRLILIQHVGFIAYNNPLLKIGMALAYHVFGRFVTRSASRIVFYSPRVKKEMTGRLSLDDRCVLIPNGIDLPITINRSEQHRTALRQKFNMNDDKFHCLFIGRFVERKGLSLIRDAATHTQADTVWHMVGWGPINTEDWNLSNVINHGTVDRATIVDYLLAADLLVLPSYGEGLPVVVQEALLCGLPCVVSDETYHNFLDTPRGVMACKLTSGGFVQCITEAKKSPCSQAEKRELVEYALSHWSWEKNIEAYLEIIDGKIQKSQTAAA